MACSNLYLIPIIAFIWFPFTFTITFLISVSLQHVHPVFPYISDTGTFAPESCVFGQMVNIGVLILALVVYIRYRQTKELYLNHNLNYNVQRLNFVCCVIGYIGCFGISIVGNFQETNVMSVHMLGAFFGFGAAALYLVLQVPMTFKLYPVSGTLCIVYLRLVICSICIVTFILCVVFAFIALHFFKGHDINDVARWTKDDGGWDYHVVSTICEWVTAMSVMFFVLTYTPEFRRLSISEPVLHIEQNLILPQNHRSMA